MGDKFRIDGTKIQFHPARVAQWLDSKDEWETAKRVAPIYWEITTSAFCQHRCTFCSTDAIGYPAIYIDPEILIQRMHEAAKLGVKSVMYGGTGEPLIHKHINQIVSGAADAGLSQAFTTNGVLLDKLEHPELCEWIKISLNAGTRDSYAEIHRTKVKDWDRVWGNIEDVKARKGNCALGVQCVVLPENVGDMYNLAFLSMEAGADYLVFKPYSNATFSIVHREDIDYRTMHEGLKAIRDEFATYGFNVIYKENAMMRESESHAYNRCPATPFMWTYSMATGEMFSCSAHLLDNRFSIGDLTKQTFAEIWQGEGRRKNWELMQEFDISACRKNCRMIGVNNYLHELATGPAHANFI